MSYETNIENQELPTHLLPGPLVGEGDEDVAGRLEGADDVILGQKRVEIMVGSTTDWGSAVVRCKEAILEGNESSTIKASS